jgi:hypothetical protein
VLLKCIDTGEFFHPHKDKLLKQKQRELLIKIFGVHRSDLKEAYIFYWMLGRVF